jgi:putative transcriptional regulator
MKRRENLVALRVENNWLQKDVVDALNERFGISISVSYYGMIEQGVRTPSLQLAIAIADLFEKPVKEVFFGHEYNDMLYTTA